MDEEFLLNAYHSKFGKDKTYIAIKDVPQHLINAVVSAEDIDFWDHHGISPFFVGYAIRENLQKKKFARGASTITMQMVRNLFLSHDRTITRKIEECIIALLLENVYRIDKKMILEIYLNLIEFAPNVYGICDGSRHYFGKEIQDLTLTEILVLTYIIPRPVFFEEALLLQTEQLKKNLYNHINHHSHFMYHREMIEKHAVESIPSSIQFKAPYKELVLREINKIILHCSATKEDRPFTAQDIDTWHKARGWDEIGYHYVILLDGTIETGRAEFKIGAHTMGQNTDSLGICYIGGLDSDGYPKDTRTPEQKIALKVLIADLLKKYPNCTIHGHNEYSEKDCPCFNVEEEFGYINQ